MKKTIRCRVFETNSSSVHTLVVFEDPNARDIWESDPDAFLDLRDVEWVDGYEEPNVFPVGMYNVVYRNGNVWNEAMEERIAWHNETIAVPFGYAPADNVEDFSDDPVELAIKAWLVPHSYWNQSPYGDWGVSCSEYEVWEQSSDDAKRYAENGYDIIQITIGDDN